MLDIEKLALPHGKIVSLTIKKGEILFIHGPNGSGKSLLLKSLASLLPCAYQKFSFHQKDLKKWDYQEYRSKVMYTAPLPHTPMDQTVEEFMRSPLELEIFQKQSFSAPVDPAAYLKEYGLSGMKLSFLSSGQKQLLSLLRLVTLNCEILLLDETMAHLDAEKIRSMEKLVLQWKEKNDGTLIIVNHVQDF